MSSRRKLDSKFSKPRCSQNRCSIVPVSIGFVMASVAELVVSSIAESFVGSFIGVVILSLSLESGFRSPLTLLKYSSTMIAIRTNKLKKMMASSEKTVYPGL